MFIVYQVTRAGKITHVNTTAVGEPMPSDIRAGIVTPLHVFPQRSEAEAYADQCRAHWNVSVKPSAAKRPEIECLQTRTVYGSIAEAADATGVSRAFLSLHINHPDRVPYVRGQTFRKI